MIGSDEFFNCFEKENMLNKITKENDGDQRTIVFFRGRYLC